MNYPWIRKDAISYGIIKVSVSNMRAQSVFQSELVNQTLMGSIVSILDKRDDFYLIQNWDAYIGWVSKHELTVGDFEMARDWQDSEKVVITENYGLIYSGPTESSQILSDLVPCIFLKKISLEGDFVKVQLPDTRMGYLKKSLCMDEPASQTIKISAAKIISQAQKFLGIPYLWGGNSTKGFDCSGFVQTVFRMLNYDLPRDSGPMSREGKNIPISGDYKNFSPGDLLFFGKTETRINHVAIYMADGQYIHSRGMVGINSLDPKHVLYEDYLKSLFVKVQRII